MQHNAVVSTILVVVFALAAVGMVVGWYRFLKEVGQDHLGTRLVTIGTGMMLVLMAWVISSIVL